MTSRLEIEIVSGGGPGQYAVRVMQSDVGETRTLPTTIDVDSIVSHRTELGRSVAHSGMDRSADRRTGGYEAALRDVGRQLFDAVFVETIRECYIANRTHAQSRGESLGIGLTFDCPELAALPWEAMYDSDREQYVCQVEPIVRRVPVQSFIAPLLVEGRLRVLGIVASPVDLPKLDVADEMDLLGNALSEPVADGRVELRWCEEGTWNRIQQDLLGSDWHVVHFIGHGSFDQTAGGAVLCLEGPEQKCEAMDAERFAVLLADAPSPPRLVVINSCLSASGAASDVFSSTATTLVRRGTTAVAAMQFPISDDAALAFSRGLYHALAVGRGIDEAMQSARTSILGSSPNTLEWVTPALYLRGRETRLFEMRPDARSLNEGKSVRGESESTGAQKGEPTVTFNNFGVTAKTVNQVGRDQYNTTDASSHTQKGPDPEVQRAAAELAKLVALGAGELEQAPDLMVDAALINKELAKPGPDKRAVAQLVERTLSCLSTDVNAKTASQISVELRPIIDWLGPEWKHLTDQLARNS